MATDDSTKTSLPSPPRPPVGTSGLSATRLLWILLILIVAWIFPWTVERVQYALTRGRERAEVEGARERLASPTLPDISKAFEQVAKSIGPSVVHIDTRQFVDGRLTDEFGSLFGVRRYEMEGQGSGVVVEPDGYILTNNHVVQGAAEILVKLSGDETHAADVVGTDPATDLAVLKINATNLVAAQWGDSDKLKPGALVWAIGNPFGLDRSITFGIVSATSRHAQRGQYAVDFLQTDAAVNPGNSGGPLVDIAGRIVGINTAIVGRTYQGITFSIPSVTARAIYKRLREGGRVIRGWLGVALEELTPKVARELGLKDANGALVTEVIKGSPADRAGLRAGDAIVVWNKQPIDTPTTLTMLVANTPIGSTVDVDIVREGEHTTARVNVEERPTERELPRR